ncbi:MAG: phenylalanine--tRNA ligase subunit beta [Planctomycetia bacterium]|nr:phenylalanine--tRNA ligase subunit beta [Planctomycetia bacterium]
MRAPFGAIPDLFSKFEKPLVNRLNINYSHYNDDSSKKRFNVQISLDWISDFVDLSDIAPEIIANRLTMSTAEVEGIQYLNRFTEGVVVGEILEAEPLPAKEGKQLTACLVDAGNRQYRTVCGAPNARKGLKAPFAPAGTELGEKKIGKTEMAGRPSEGILCSAAELGMSSWHEILFECPANTKNGTPFSELVPKSDVLIEIDNKSLTHRPDLWGHYGFARELAAIFHRPLKPLPRHCVDQYSNLPAFPIKIDDPNCPCYSALAFGITAGSTGIPSSITMQRRLHALGQRTYNLLIDVTNYVSLEIGQPTHAFDGDLVHSIRVAPMGQKGKFRTLDGVDRDMLPEDMMICEGDKPIAIAGIMGGEETEVTDRTTRILLESANFRSARIRVSVGRLDLRTDASQRYEKSQPPANVKVATERILKLIEDSGTKFQVESRFSLAGDLADAVRTITIKPGRLNHLAGIDFPKETILSILQSIGFEAEFQPDQGLKVGIPPFRSAKDISIEEDIVEEVMRLYGFDNIPPVLPELPLKPLFIEKSIRMDHKAQRLLSTAYGYMEVHNYGWFNDDWCKKIGFDPGTTLVLQNPAAQPESRLRTTLLPNLFALIPKNRASRDQFRIFELGHVYFPIGEITDQSFCEDSAAKCREVSRLAGISFLQAGLSLEEHYLQIKAAVEDLGAIYSQDEKPFKFAAAKDPQFPWESQDYSVDILQGDQKIGTLGVADKKFLNIVSPEGGQIVWFEIALDKIAGNLYPHLKISDPPKFPGSWQDFSIVWKIDAGYEKLEALLDEFSDPLLIRREFLTLYKGKGLEKGEASYSFRFIIGAEDHTLSGAEIEAFHQKFLAFLQTKSISIR